MMIIDRFEGKFAIIELEKGKFLQIPREILPPEAREGDVITLKIDRKQTAQRRRKVEELLQELRKD
ncbi:MAG TPA: DUF3006 domain-containing protein [Firmicutes bacterium]|nr:DUF3006 domain-containing protein [Bacillota bacterium]